MQAYKNHGSLLLAGLFLLAHLAGCGASPEHSASSEEPLQSWGTVATSATEELDTASEVITPSATSQPASEEDFADTYLPHETPPAESVPAEQAENPEPPAETIAPQPSPAPADTGTSSSIGDLETTVKNQISSYRGTWSLYFKRLDTGESFCINDSSMVAASLIKLYVYGAASSAVENGTLSNYDSTLRSMISDSDNTACNTLIDAVGMSAVNSFISQWGYAQSQLNRKMLASGNENYTSTSDCGALLEQVYNGSYVSADTSEALLDAMLNQSRRWKIPAGLPGGTTSANKTGELSDVENDAAIVYSPSCTYILCIMSDGVNPGTAQSNIVELSRTIYNYLN